MAYTKRTQYSRATFGSSGDNQQKSILSISYGYTKGRGLTPGATTINLNHNVPAGAVMRIVTRTNSTGATVIQNVTSYTSPAASSNSVATIPTAVAAGKSYTVHYYFANWHINPINDEPVFLDSGII